MTHFSDFKVAVAQTSPIVFNREALTEKTCQLIADAAQTGARLVAFGETRLPGYPVFAWQRQSELWWEAAAEYLQNAEVPLGTTGKSDS